MVVMMIIVHEMTRNPDTTDLSITTKSNYEEKKKEKKNKQRERERQFILKEILKNMTKRKDFYKNNFVSEILFREKTTDS